MKRILGLDLGTNSIGWALVEQDFDKKEGKIEDLGVRIIPMSGDVLGKFEAGQSHSQTAERTTYRGKRRLYQRDNLRRERLHRVLNILGLLPKHYVEAIDFEKKLGQFKPGKEVKLNYAINDQGKHEFIFKASFNEMLSEFKTVQPQLFYKKENGVETKIPYDWTLYYLRKKALTKPLTKEELAWVILNFNQKRGYYQLRGEEIETDETKKEEYYNLKVEDVQETEDKNARGTWYNVILENDWVYRRQSKEPLDSWIGKNKEFIVTTQLEKDGSLKLDKDGHVKRSFRAVDSEKDWIAIKVKTEHDIEQSNKTVGTYIYENLLVNPNQKIRGKLVKTIERKFYKDEFSRIINKQIELQPELFTDELYQKCIEELYPRNEAHRISIKDKGFSYLFADDIIFYQRPLKSQKSTIAECPLEFRVYKQKNEETGEVEEIKKGIKAISKSHPLFQEYRIWQWLQNLKIYNKEQIKNGALEDVTAQLLPDEEAWVALFDFLNAKKELEQKQFIDYFVKKKLIDKKEKDHYRWNYVEDKKYPFAETRAQFISRLSKVEGLHDVETFLDEKIKMGKKEKSPYMSRMEQLWHIIYSVTDVNEYKSALEKFAQKHDLDTERFVKNFEKFPPFKSAFGSYSQKAIIKLLPLMRRGKYWDETLIADDIKDRAEAIMERVHSLSLKSDYSDKDLKQALENVSDDDVPKQLVRSFVSFKDTNPIQGLNTYQATYLVYGRHAELGEIQQWRTPNDIDDYLKKFKQHSLRNPIVEQVVTETLRVVRDIWKQYGDGKQDFFNEIHVELGREMKNPADKRKKISERNNENENTNHRIKELLKELMNDSSIKGDIRDYSPSQQDLLKIYEEGVYQNPEADYSKVSEDEISKIRKTNHPTKKEIQRYRLWLDQGYISPYTGKPIPLSKLFTDEYQIEHIIPQARYFDNSLSNKVICESVINPRPYKGEQTAYEFIKNMGGQIVPKSLTNEEIKIYTLEEYESHVNQYFKNNKTKLKNLLSEDIPEGFINRQLNDSRYISKLIKGLLSNIVRLDGEQEATSKNLIPVTGAVTSKLKNDWGLNDKWNEIILPRFERLNELTQSIDFTTLNTNGKIIPTVPDELSKGFNKKRIDHRHHALDALVVACVTRNHTHYLSALNAENNNFSLRDKLLIKNNQGDYTKTFKMPWEGFATEAKNQLEKTVVSFKQNLRVINKTTNKFWSYKDEKGNLNLDKNGKPIKKLRKQTKGDSWAIRKPLHEETVSGKVNLPWVKLGKGEITTATRERHELISIFKDVKTRDKAVKKIYKITDLGIQKILLNYLKSKDNNPELAFSPEGIEDLNKNISEFNEGKFHHPIFKVRTYEKGKGRFVLGEKGNKISKYVQGSPNLFFAIYWDENKQKRNFETIPLNEVIAHQKQVAHLPKKERLPIQPNSQKGSFLFTLSPNDLVYVPTVEEQNNPNLVDFNGLSVSQASRIYKMVSSSGNQCFFVKENVSKMIWDKKEYSALNKMERSIEGVMIKEVCWKLQTDRLGNISKQ